MTNSLARRIASRSEAKSAKRSFELKILFFAKFLLFSSIFRFYFRFALWFLALSMTNKLLGVSARVNVARTTHFRKVINYYESSKNANVRKKHRLDLDEDSRACRTGLSITAASCCRSGASRSGLLRWRSRVTTWRNIARLAQNIGPCLW